MVFDEARKSCRREEEEVLNPLGSNVQSRCRSAFARMNPYDYLSIPCNKKSDSILALAALLGVDGTNWHCMGELVTAIKAHCPRLLANRAAVHQMLLHGSDAAIVPVLMFMRNDIVWDKELVLLALPKCQCFWFPASLPSACFPEDEALRAIRSGLKKTHAHSQLLKNKVFLLEALVHDPWIFAYCGREWVYDKDVLLTVASAADEGLILNLEDILRHKLEIEPNDVLMPLAHYVKTQLDYHVTFCEFLKCLQCVARPEQKNNPLQLLQCGEETTTAFKRQIAAFLGAPTVGDEIAVMKKAWTHISCYYTVAEVEKGHKRKRNG